PWGHDVVRVPDLDAPGAALWQRHTRIAYQRSEGGSQPYFRSAEAERCHRANAIALHDAFRDQLDADVAFRPDYGLPPGAEYSLGPDGIDQLGGGDDVPIVDRKGPRYLTWFHSRMLLVQLTAVMGACLLLAWWLPRSGRAGEELLLTGTIVATLVPLGALAHV